MRPKMMKARFVALFLLIISAAHFTFEEGISLIQSNGQAMEPLGGKLDGNGSMENSTWLNHKVELEENKNEHKHELFHDTRRKGGSSGGGKAGAGRSGGRARGGRNKGKKGFIGGGASVNSRRHHSHNSAPSLFSGPHFWGLYVSLVLNLLVSLPLSVM